MKSALGASFLELVLVVLLISLLGGVFFDRSLFYQEQAEKIAMEQMVGILRSALRLQIAERLTKGRHSAADIVADNPMDWLQKIPINYLGERFDPAPGSVPGESWYFDLRDKTLVYVVAGRHFTGSPSGQKKVRYRVRRASSAKPQASQDHADKQTIEGVTLDLVEPYRWF